MLFKVYTKLLGPVVRLQRPGCRSTPSSFHLMSSNSKSCRQQHQQAMGPRSGSGSMSGSRFLSHSLIGSKSDLSRFLIEIGTDPREARYWLKQFTSVRERSEAFAVICVDHSVLNNQIQIEKFASSISFLYRNGMSPIIVYGPKGKFDSFKEMKDSCVWSALKLGDLLEQHGAYPRVLYPGSGAVLIKSSESGENDEKPKIQVSNDMITNSLSTQHLPIVLSYGETACGQIKAVEPWELTVQISRIVQPVKVMEINTHGGFVDSAGKVIANINLPVDLNSESQKSWCTPEILETMTKVNDILCYLGAESSVVITSADTMLMELFSHRGSGTFFRVTEALHRHTSLDRIDIGRMKMLLQRSFQKELEDSYFEYIAPRIHSIYLSETYSGAAILLKGEKSGIPYMCKFAVSTTAQGQGTGEMLWGTIKQHEPRLYWRSMNFNRINTWYFQNCEGCWNDITWTIFWYGVADPNLSSGIVREAVTRPISFKERKKEGESGSADGS